MNKLQTLTLNGKTYDSFPDQEVRETINELIESGVLAPAATVEQTDGGAVITITDKNGTTTATVSNGATGAAGYTPEKGTDYWTSADKAAMVNDVLAALPTWTGGSY